MIHVWRVTPGGVRCFEAASGGGGGASAIRAGAAFVELFVKNNQLMRGLDAAKKKVEAFGKFTSSVGSSLFKIGASAIAPLALAVRSLGQSADIDSTAKAFGLTAEEASRLFGIMASSGSELRDATEGLVTFGQKVKDAMSGGGEEAAKFFDQLGVSAAEFEGLNPAQQFYKVLDAIKKVEDPAARVQLLLKAFGEDTGKNLLKLLGLSAEELKGIGDTAEMSQEELTAASTATRAWHSAVSMLSRAWDKVAVALAPTLTEASGRIAEFAARAAALVRDYSPLVPLFFKAAGVIAGAGAALYVFGAAASAVAAGVGLVTGAVTLLATAFSAIAGVAAFALTPLGGVTAAVALLAYELWPDMKAAFADVMGIVGPGLADLGDTFRKTFGGISDALKSKDLQTAMEIAMAGITVAWLKALRVMEKAWERSPIGMALSKPPGSDEPPPGADAAGAGDGGGGGMTILGKRVEWGFDGAIKGIAGLFSAEKELAGLREAEALTERMQQARVKAGKKRLEDPDSPELVAAEARLKALLDKVAPPPVEQGPEPRAFEAGPKPREVGAATGRVWAMIREVGERAAEAAKMASAVTFSGRNAAQRLGYGGTVQELIQKNTKKAADEAEKINENIAKLDGEPLKFD